LPSGKSQKESVRNVSSEKVLEGKQTIYSRKGKGTSNDEALLESLITESEQNGPESVHVKRGSAGAAAPSESARGEKSILGGTRKNITKKLHPAKGKESRGPTNQAARITFLLVAVGRRARGVR